MQPPPTPIPPPYPPYAPPPRRAARPWWIWLLGGCAGCGIVTVLALVGTVYLGFRAVEPHLKQAQSVTADSVRKQLGPEVPLYPESVLNRDMTGVLLVTIRTMEGLLRQGEGAFFRGLGYYEVNETPEKVTQWYRARLQAAGWKPAEASGSPRSDALYQKGKEFLYVKVETAQAAEGTAITLMRGGRTLAEAMAERSRSGANNSEGTDSPWEVEEPCRTHLIRHPPRIPRTHRRDARAGPGGSGCWEAVPVVGF